MILLSVQITFFPEEKEYYGAFHQMTIKLYIKDNKETNIYFSSNAHVLALKI
jgi:hypothetical protein